MLLKENLQRQNSHQNHTIKKLKQQLDSVDTYQEWKSIALRIDELSGAEAWKLDNQSDYFDAEVIGHRLMLLQRYRLQKRSYDLVHIIREGLSFDVANISHPLLFTFSQIGTKKIIEDYVAEMSKGLQYLASSECSDLTLSEKIDFFKHCEKAYGQPALMFSGGATLGLFHTGVCKALIEQDLMPTVLSGSSAGAIMTAMLGVSRPEDVNTILSGENFFSEAFHFRNLKEILQDNGGFADVRYLKKFLIENLGDLTFEEAFAKSGLHINIAVAPYDASQDAKILNAYTSPDVMVWSAVLASCAVPILFPPIRLTSKKHDGTYTPYMASTRWVDGSVRSDFPQEKLARLYNLNYTIASQVNPHVVPFMQTEQQRYRKDMLSWPERIIRHQGKEISKTFMDFARERAGRLPPIRRLLDHGYGVIDQRYYGDLNIVGKYSLRHYTYMLQNPRPYLFKILQGEGERATWAKIAAIETQARIGKTIEHCLKDLYNTLNES